MVLGWAWAVWPGPFCLRKLSYNDSIQDKEEDFYHRVGFVDIEENGGYMKMYKMLRV